MKLFLHKKTGFTLYEILVTLAILGITMVILSYILLRGIEIYTRGKNITIAKNKLDTIACAINSDFGSCSKITPLTLGKNPGDPLYYGGQGSQSVTFERFDPVRGIETVTYALRAPAAPKAAAKDGYDLIRADSSGESVVEDGIKDIRFKYTNNTPPNAGFDGSMIAYQIKLMDRKGVKEEYAQITQQVNLATGTGLIINSITSTVTRGPGGVVDKLKFK